MTNPHEQWHSDPQRGPHRRKAHVSHTSMLPQTIREDLPERPGVDMEEYREWQQEIELINQQGEENRCSKN